VFGPLFLFVNGAAMKKKKLSTRKPPPTAQQNHHTVLRVYISFPRFSKSLKAIKEKENVIQLSSSLFQVCFKRAIKKAPEVSWDFFSSLSNIE